MTDVPSALPLVSEKEEEESFEKGQPIFHVFDSDSIRELKAQIIKEVKSYEHVLADLPSALACLYRRARKSKKSPLTAISSVSHRH